MLKFLFRSLVTIILGAGLLHFGGCCQTPGTTPGTTCEVDEDCGSLEVCCPDIIEEEDCGSGAAGDCVLACDGPGATCSKDNGDVCRAQGLECCLKDGPFCDTATEACTCVEPTDL